MITKKYEDNLYLCRMTVDNQILVVGGFTRHHAWQNMIELVAMRAKK